MAIPFAEPSPSLRFNSATEIRAIDDHFKLRGVPRSSSNRLLLASWNIANLGAQGRTRKARAIIAHIMKRFDLIAIQELNDDYRTFVKILKEMGTGFDFIMSDTAGNDERLAFVYRSNRVRADRLFGEIALRPREYPRRTVHAHYRKNRRDYKQTFSKLRFVPFDRNPFIGSFKSGRVDFVLANVHLYFGAFQNSGTEEKRRKYARRVLEIYALAKWAKDRGAGGNAWDKDIVLLGDMNVPNMEKNESAFQALQQFGWTSVDYRTKDSGGARAEDLSHIGGTNLGNNKTYDQIAFAPTALRGRIRQHGVFDFDNAVFSRKWNALADELTHGRAVKKFNSYVRHHISDHRPIWVQLRTS